MSVDADARRLYISHGSQVEVLNADTHEKIGVIPNLKGVHGVIAVPGTGRGVTTNGRSNSATIFDKKTLKPIAELPTGKNPDALIYDPFSKRVFVFNHSDTTATAIDVAAGKVVGIVHIGGEGLEAGASDGKGNIYVNLEDASEIAMFDAVSLKLKNKWKIAPCEEPTGLGIDTQTKRLFSACGNELMAVVDSESGKLIAKVPTGKHTDGAAFDPDLKMAFTSNGEGTITVIKEVSANEYKVIETIKTEPGARTIALDTKTHHVFVTTAQYGEAPAATAQNPHPRPKVIPGTFMVLEYGMK
ncbi:MAG: YncE family protein [Bacteroidetes bacterium]|nr:YncE family protein [Bacteroidota bacterium]MBS1539633.1 YncE family protein [Bacteroidota bacterium]